MFAPELEPPRQRPGVHVRVDTEEREEREEYREVERQLGRGRLRGPAFEDAASRVREFAFEDAASRVREFAEARRTARIALVGRTMDEARLMAWKVLESGPIDNMPRFEAGWRRITWPNGAVAILYSADDPGQLRGPVHHHAWTHGLCLKCHRTALELLRLGLRLGPRRVMLQTES